MGHIWVIFGPLQGVNPKRDIKQIDPFWVILDPLDLTLFLASKYDHFRPEWPLEQESQIDPWIWTPQNLSRPVLGHFGTPLLRGIWPNTHSSSLLLGLPCQRGVQKGYSFWGPNMGQNRPILGQNRPILGHLGPPQGGHSKRDIKQIDPFWVDFGSYLTPWDPSWDPPREGPNGSFV